MNKEFQVAAFPTSDNFVHLFEKMHGRPPRIALIHEWLTTYAGSEKVFEQLCFLYPTAAIFCVIASPEALKWNFLLGREVKTSFIQKLPFALSKYRNYLPLMPLAIEQFDLSEFDVIISSSHAVAKGVISGPDQIHISYVHSPMRYAWDLQHQYLKESGITSGLKSVLVRWRLHHLRLWDIRSSLGVDYFIANSKFISRRIAKAYKRDAVVIFPPVDIEAFPLSLDKDNFYVTASRMVPYKRVDLIVEAFTAMPQFKLVVIGTGPDYDRIKHGAGPNVEFMGYQSNEKMVRFFQRAKAFVFAAEEDFGILPVEAQACGTPVIAFGKGGALETVRQGDCPTGLFFYRQDVESIIEAVQTFENSREGYSPQMCRDNAEKFSIANFRKSFDSFLSNAYVKFLAD